VARQVAPGRREAELRLARRHREVALEGREHDAAVDGGDAARDGERIGPALEVAEDAEAGAPAGEVSLLHRRLELDTLQRLVGELAARRQVVVAVVAVPRVERAAAGRGRLVVADDLDVEALRALLED